MSDGEEARQRKKAEWLYGLLTFLPFGIVLLIEGEIIALIIFALFTRGVFYAGQIKGRNNG